MRKVSSSRLLIVCAALFAAGTATATQPYHGDEIRGKGLLPADGAVDVPLNAHVRLALRGATLSTCELGDPTRAVTVEEVTGLLEQVVLEDAQGLTVPSTVRVYVTPVTLDEDPGGYAQVIDHRWLVELIPSAPLAPETEHVIRAPFEIREEYAAQACLSPGAAIGRFKTGSDMDVAAPDGPPIVTASALSFKTEDPHYSDVFQFNQVTFQLALQPTSDEPHATYHLYRVGAGGEAEELLHSWMHEAAVGGDPVLTLGRFCSWSTNIMWHTPMDLVVPLGEASYVVRAVDLAGNTSAASDPVMVTLSCDAGNGGTLPGDLPISGDEPVEESSGSGCRLAPAASPAGSVPAVLLLVLTGLLGRFRLRRRRA